MQKNIKHKQINEHATIAQATGFLHLRHHCSNTYLLTDYFWNNALQSFLSAWGRLPFAEFVFAKGQKENDCECEDR